MEQPGNPETNDRLASCLLTNSPRGEETNYQLIDHGDGTNMYLGVAPYMISGKAADELFELLSAKTKDIPDDFIDENFGLPPEQLG